MTHRRGPRPPPIPPPQTETLRRRIASLLRAQPMSARDLALELRLREREVIEHLEHLRRSHVPLLVTPAACRDCGFVFRSRDRLGRPSRCPRCRSESLDEPLFAVDPEPPRR